MASSSKHPPPEGQQPPAPPVDKPTTKPIPLLAAQTLLNSFVHFLTISIHTILHHRGLYPPETFLRRKAYNHVVYQSRHPEVCTWIDDAATAVKAQLRYGHVRHVALVVHSPVWDDHRVLERWLFDVERFPLWIEKKTQEEEEEESYDREARFANLGIGGGRKAERELKEAKNERDRRKDRVEARKAGVNFADVDMAYRGAIAKIMHRAEGMENLPDECTFTVTIELREEAPAPIGNPQPWIPSEPDLQPATASNPTPGKALGGAAMATLRSVEAGPLFFECWVEETDVKAELLDELRREEEERRRFENQRRSDNESESD